MEIPFHESTARATTEVVPSRSKLWLTQQSISPSTVHPQPFLKRAELHRRLWHMLPGLLPFILSAERPLPWNFLAMVAGITVLLSLGALLCYRTFARDGEKKWALNSMSYAAIALPPLFLFRSHPEVTAVVVTVLAFGDGSATLFGLLFGQRVLPWNTSKTWAGFFGFFLGAFPVATLAYWKAAEPSVPLTVAMMCALPAVMIAQFAESMSIRGTDNFRVGGAALVGVLLAHTAMFGWP